MRRSSSLRHLLPWALALATVTCAQDQLDPSRGGVGYFAFRPVYQLAGGAHLSQFNIVADSVHIRLTRPVAQVVLDTTVFFPPDSAQLRLALPVELTQSPESLTALVEISSAGTVVFRDSLEVEVKDGPPGTSTPPTVTFTYVGPGTNIGTLHLVPGDTTIVLTDTLFFSALAFDSSAAPVTSFYVGWKTSDTTVARINATGQLVAPAARGSVSVIGFTPTGIADTTLVTFAPVPVAIYPDSGSGQTSLVGDSLPALFVARVMAADSLGVAGIPVRFTAVTAGGAVRDTIVTTDATGRARTRGVLGTSAVTYDYSATALGTALAPALFIAGALPATPAAIAIQSGDAQTDTAGLTLPAALTVKVTDAFGNAAPGARVAFTRVFGAGTVATDTATADGTGQASTIYTLGATVGTDSIRAALVGTSGTVTFTATAIPGGPAAVAADSGNAQSAAVTVAFAESLVARVTDAHGNAVPGAKVAWIVTAGSGTLSTDTTLSGADGRARVAVTAGVTAGALHVQGSAAGAGSTAQFALTVTPGAPAAFVMVSGDTQSALPGGVLAQPLVVAVRDAHGNGIAGQAVAFTVTAGLGAVDSATATTDASGLANSGNWTLGPVAGTNQVRATIGALPADTLLFTATGLPAGTTKQWLGAVDTAWNVAGNWSPSGAPGASDNVFIPASATNQPVVGFTGSVGGLSVEAGATVKVAAGVSLNTTGNLSIAGAMTGPGTVTVNGSGTTLAGTFSGPVLWIAGTVSQNGPLSSVGDVTVNAGTLTTAGFPLAAAGNFTMGGTGKLVMTNAADSVDVTGAFAANSSASGAGSLTAGVLVLRGGFTAISGNDFSASGTHRTRFAGSAAQTIDIATPGFGATIFRDVEFADPAGITLTANGIAASGLTSVTAGAVNGSGSVAQIGAGGLQATYADWQVSNTILQAAPSVYPDSLPGNVTLLAPWTLSKSFSVDSVLLISTGGVLTVGGHRLTVNDLSQGNRLVMQSPADTVDVKEALVVTSAVSGAGDLTDGLLILRNTFSQSGASASFRPSGAHRTLITSAGSAALAFQSVGSGFNQVTFDAAGGTAIAGNLSVSGNVLAQTGVVSSPDTLVMTGDTLTRGPGAVWAVTATDVATRLPELPDSVSGSLILRDTVSLSAPLFVLNDLILDGGTGTVFANQHRIWTDGALTVRNGALLRMAAGDTVHVTGNATFAGRPTNGALTGGLLELQGNFSVLDDSGFVAAPAHQTVFTGTATPILFFSVAAAGHGEFGGLDLTNALNGITLATDVRVGGKLTKVAGTDVNVAGGGHTITVNGDLTVDGMIFDAALLVARDSDNVATFDNVSFIDQDPTRTQFTFTGPGGSDTLKFHNIGFGTVPTTGHYVTVADSTANGLPVQVAFYNSTPLNGSAHELTDAAGGDAAKVLWSRLVWSVQPDTGISGGLFTPAPSVAAVDPDSVRITGYTGTVTVTLAVDPSGGTAVLTGNSVAAVAGLATFDSLSVSVANAGYVFQASSPELGTSAPSQSALVLVPVPLGTTTAFTNGGGDGSWDTPTNWTAGVPDSADNVFIYPNLTATVNNASRANRITVGTGASLVLNNTLTVDSSVAAGNTISGGGSLIAQGAGQLSGQMGDLVVLGAYDVPAGDTLSAQSISIAGVGFLDLGLGEIHVTDTISTTSAGHLNVNNAAGLVTVGGNVAFGGGASTLTAGTLRLGGNLTGSPATAAFAPNFTTDFNGTGHRQVVTFTGADSANGLGGVMMSGDSLAFQGIPWVTGNFNLNTGVTQILDTLGAAQGVGGTGAALLTGGTFIVRGPILFPGTYSVPTTAFAGAAPIRALSTPYDTVVVLGADTLAANVSATKVTVDGSQGWLVLGGHRFDVAGDFATNSFGRFSMMNASDTLAVGGNFTAAGGGTNGLLTAGLLQIAGNFAQNGGVSSSFQAEPGHTTRLTGTGSQIYFISPLDVANPDLILTSYFGRLEFWGGIDTLPGTVSAKGDVDVNFAQVHGTALGSLGNVTVIGSAILGVTDLALTGTLSTASFTGTYAVGTTHFLGTGQPIPVLPYQDIDVEFGDATLTGNVAAQNVRLGLPSAGAGYPGELRFGGFGLTLSGNLQTVGQGSFTMFNPGDSLDVAGAIDLSAGGKRSDLTAGTVVARGAMSLVDTSIAASGTHRVVFANAAPQTLTIAAAAGTEPVFNKLDVAPGTTVDFARTSTGGLVVADSFGVHGFFLQAAPGAKVTALGDLYVGTSVGITVDTVELHKGIDVDLSTFSTQLVRYVGTGQTVDSFVSYHDLEVTGTAALAGPTTVGHQLRVRGSGTLDLAGHRVIVADSLQVADSGLMVMTSPADTADVGATASFDGRDSEGWLTAGALITNYFTQLATTSPKAFAATGAHRVVLKQQDPLDQGNTVQFATPGATTSRFQELELNGGGSGYTYFAGSAAYVADSLVIPASGSFGVYGSGVTLTVAGPFVAQYPSLTVQLDTLVLQGPVSVPVYTMQNGVTRFDGPAQVIPDSQSYSGIEVTGTATLEPAGNVTASSLSILGNGHFTLGAGQQFLDFGALNTAGNGVLTMNDPTADLSVNGSATFAGGSTAGQLTAGTLSILGDLTQSNATSDSAFHPVVGHLTRFTGSRHHTVAFATPSLNYGANFGDLQVNAYDTLDLNGSHPAVFGHTTLDPTAALVDAAGTGVFEALGPFTAGSFGTIALHDLELRDTVSIDPTVGYSAFYTGFDFYTLAIPSLAYTNIVIQDGSPSLGGPITASGFVSVNGTQFTGGGGTPMTLTFNGNRLSAAGFSTGSYGAIVMDQPGDSLIVTGAAGFQGQSELGKLTAGYIQFGGDLSTDTVSGGARSAFVTQGTAVDFTLGPTHTIHFFDPDSSYLPSLLPGGAAALALNIQGRARIAGDLNAYGLALAGDTLEVDSTLTGGPAGASADLTMLRTGHIYGGTSFSTFKVGTTQITAPDYLLSLPYDTLMVSDTLRGSLSQVVTANHVEVTGPGNPHHRGIHAGWLYLAGGDGNTILNVTGNVLVSGKFATIYSNFGTLSATGNLDVTDNGLLVSNVGGCCGTSTWDIGGSATFAGASTTDSLTSGILYVGGDLVEGGGAPDAFAADSDFITKFQVGGAHKIAFQDPTPAGGGGSHFGSLELGNGAGIVLQTSTDLWAEGTLIDTTFSNPTLQNTGGALHTLTVRDVDVQGITFDHLQLHLQKNGAPRNTVSFMDIVNFTNFLTSEDQFLVDLPGTSTQFNWSNFTFTQLTTGDAGHYVVANDTDGPTPDILTISLGTSQSTAADLPFFIGLNGAVITPFAP